MVRPVDRRDRLEAYPTLRQCVVAVGGGDTLHRMSAFYA
jgi:hypothetical protein